MEEIKIDPYFKNLFPPLSSQDYEVLEKSLTENGYDPGSSPITLWHGYIVDGHNRYEICKKHNIPFPVGYLKYENRDEVIEWMLRIQLGRRNLTPIQKIAIAEKYRSIFEKQAKNNQKKGGRGEKVVTPVDVTKNLSKIAGVGRSTYFQGRQILLSEHDDIKREVLNGKKKINTAYIAMKRKNQPNTDWDFQNCALSVFIRGYKKLFIVLKDILKDMSEKINQEELNAYIGCLEKMEDELKQYILSVKKVELKH